ncbi:MAG TPA: DUF4956 domain-containing protein [Clostridiales bacterium]|nr:DUF4956 domain-containing protein [Clostridiales bacterium]
MTQQVEQIFRLMFNTAGMSYKRMLFALLFSTGVSIFIFVVYRLITKKSFYSKSFNITLPIVTVMTTAIVVAMQANLVVSLGMVGALSIVRFRTALKDALDLGFVFWAISAGIISGTELYLLVILMSLIVTLALFLLQAIPMKEAPHLLIVNGSNIDYEPELMRIVKEKTSRHAVKSRNLRKENLDLIVEIRTKNDEELIHAVREVEGVESASILKHDGSLRY